jgi:hypothetical protein
VPVPVPANLFKFPLNIFLDQEKYLKIIPICFIFLKKWILVPVVPPLGWLKIHFNNKISIRKSDPDSDLVVNVLDPDPGKKCPDPTGSQNWTIHDRKKAKPCGMPRNYT